MAKTFLELMEELNALYDEIISLMPYHNDPEISRKMRNLRTRASEIESIVIPC